MASRLVAALIPPHRVLATLKSWTAPVAARARWAGSMVLAGLVLAACGEPNGGPSAGGAAAGLGAGAKAPRGHWYKSQDAGAIDERAEAARALESIGYASGMEEGSSRFGVLAHDATRAQPGLNLYVSGHGAEARLVEMDGTLVHRWERSPLTIWPERADLGFGYFRKARLLDDGGILAIFEGKGLVCLDRDSNVRWSYDGPAHHDVGVLPDGRVFSLDREARIFASIDPERLLLDDRITIFSPEGEVLQQVSLMGALMRSPFAERTRSYIRTKIDEIVALRAKTRERYAEEIARDPALLERFRFTGDVFHTNSVRVVSEEVAAAIDGLEAGWFLLSVREMNALIALEIEGDGAIARWYLDGSWQMQHEAVPLPTGRILVFDNQGGRRSGVRGRSRVVEVEPRDGAIAWEYAGAGARGLNSPVGGSCQRLANGNTLVIESTAGRAVEVTAEGAVVWEFVSPHRAGEDEELIAFLPDVVRVERSTVERWLARGR